MQKRNKMQQVKTQGQDDQDIKEDGPLVPSEQSAAPARVTVPLGQHPCPQCKREMALVTERVHGNRVVRQYRCTKCGKFVTEA